MNIINVTRHTRLAAQGKMALTFWSRLKGLLFTDFFPAGEGILIKPCASIHTIGMSYAIDILFVDEADRVIKTVIGIKPYRFAYCRGSSYVIEVPTGTVLNTGTKLGDEIRVS